MFTPETRLRHQTRRLSVLRGLGIKPPDRLSGTGRRVVAHLALRGPRELRGVVCADLWPDVPDGRARANLRRALWQLPTGWVVVDGSDLSLDAAVDLREARELANRVICGGEALTWADVDLLSADVLPGWFEEWVLVERESFHLLRVQALEAACRGAIAHHDLVLATHAGLTAVQAEPLRESAVAALVQAHLAEGNRSLAIRQYQRYARDLEAELHVDPGEDLVQLLRR